MSATTRTAHAAATGPRWRCRITPCPTRGVWTDAPTAQAAAAAWRRHYTTTHWARPEGAR
ncbi:hypothetical protein ACIHFD_49160 [Nonomuraea sp. NPDC051941]|uniref:hypothetical protein n=1 Tax=Nonomuraea sp. NPDC051941 TaxID=3364373 RepID=UPI0037CC2088